MGNFSLGRLALFLIALIAGEGVLLFWNGLLMITLHEGDAMHTVQILMRMDQGQLPHLDFLTPIGILAFAPISLFMSLGVGKAILAGNLFMAAAAVPAILWTAKTRLTVCQSYGFGAGVIVLITAMIHGESIQVTSISMYYNRWAWAVAFLVVLVAILPAKQRKTQGIDGFILGLGMSFLALSKVTFFVALLPAVIAALLLRKQWKSILASLATGAAVIVIVTVLTGGIGFWTAYLSDLLIVNNAGVRSFPSRSMVQLLIGPSFLLPNFLLLLSVVLLRQSGRLVEGIILLLLAPAFIYITYQNWGNDPQWLFVLGIILLALRQARSTLNPLGRDMRAALGMAGTMALVIIAPSALNLAFSTAIHARLDPAEFSVLLKDPRDSNLVVQTKLLYAPIAQNEVTIPNAKMAALGDTFGERKKHSLYGQPLTNCKLHRGMGGMMQFYARELDKLGYTNGKTVFVADLFSNLWLFGDTVPLKNGSPWYYGGDVGLARADFLLVPFCPSVQTVWEIVLNDLAKDGAPVFKEIHRTDFFTLFKRQEG